MWNKIGVNWILTSDEVLLITYISFGDDIVHFTCYVLLSHMDFKRQNGFSSGDSFCNEGIWMEPRQGLWTYQESSELHPTQRWFHAAVGDIWGHTWCQVGRIVTIPAIKMPQLMQKKHFSWVLVSNLFPELIIWLHILPGSGMSLLS